MEIGGARMCLGGMLVSQSLQYGAKTLFRHSPERHNFCRLTILRHSNIKMVAYKLSKNGWVMPFFVIFRLAREKLLVTVALDHPVYESGFKFQDGAYQGPLAFSEALYIRMWMCRSVQIFTHPSTSVTGRQSIGNAWYYIYE